MADATTIDRAFFSFFVDQPDELFHQVLEFCSDSTLTAFRSTNKKLKSIAESIVEERTFKNLPINLKSGEHTSNQTLLSLEFDQNTVRDREMLINLALSQLHSSFPRMRVSQELVREQLGSQGVFCHEAHFDGVTMDWRVELKVNLESNLGVKEALEKVIFCTIWRDFPQNSSLNRRQSCTDFRRAAFYLLLRAAERGPIQYASISHDYTDELSLISERNCILSFQASNGRQVELQSSGVYQFAHF
mmetsp:Transcript_15557/g.20260  ORF Transcript_15557/g.20260 Transcript_15557/m.20260 type:complete len:246 (-) Transcript_15557:140-877(-)